jgi:VWFA-related protein
MRCCGVDTGSGARLSAGFLIALTCSAALSQDPVLKTRTKEEREKQFNAIHRIRMNVQVTDAAGKPVADLRPENFTLYDNHQPRKIVAFHPIDGAALSDATEVLIVLDAVNTPPQALDAAKAAIFKYLAGSRKPFESPTAFALWFNGHMSATTATTDRNAIGRAFVKMTRNVHSNACDTAQTSAQQKIATSKNSGKVSPAACRAVHFKDSVAALAGMAQQQLATGGRTLLIWIGSGWPVLPNAELDGLGPKQQEAYTHEFVEVLHDLRAAQVTVYSIAPDADKDRDGSSNGSENSKMSSKNAVAKVPRIALDEYAQRTGGRVLSSHEDITADLHACIQDAEWYYSLSFNAPPAQNGAGEMHSLEVKVNRPGLQVRTMNSYYSEPR